MSKIDDIIAARKAAEEAYAGKPQLPSFNLGNEARIVIDDERDALVLNRGGSCLAMIRRDEIRHVVLWLADLYGVALPREPVQVPEPLGNGGSETPNYVDGWNACRNETLRLNADTATDNADPGPVAE